MFRTNLARLSAIAGIVVMSTGTPARAEVDVELSVDKVFRQYRANSVEFREGGLLIAIGDGNATYQPGCLAPFYFGPSIPCPDGATGFIGFGNLDPEAPEPATYYMITGITPAIAIAPKHPEKCVLRAAPQTSLKRPVTGFVDNSFSLFYNIAPGSISIREYLITIYNYQRSYTGVAGGRRLKDEIVPGVYHFSFPKLGNPDLPVAVPLTHYTMADGFERVRNVRQGVRFVNLPGRFDRDGFVRVDLNRLPNFQWVGLSRSNIFPSDRLYFSIRPLRNPNNPRSPVRGRLSIFPAVESGADPRVLLANPLVSNYLLPPLVDSGSRGVVELELLRSVTTNGVTYDRSRRKYQMPVFFVDQYKVYRNINLGRSGPNRGLLADFDGDGVNNMTEWALGSRANDSTSVPRPPVPTFVPATLFTPSYFRLRQAVRDGMFPAVRYVFQRSDDGGQTWRFFNGDNFWTRVDEPGFEGFIGGVFGGPDLPPDQVPYIYRVIVRLDR